MGTNKKEIEKETKTKGKGSPNPTVQWGLKSRVALPIFQFGYVFFSHKFVSPFSGGSGRVEELIRSNRPGT